MADNKSAVSGAEHGHDSAAKAGRAKYPSYITGTASYVMVFWATFAILVATMRPAMDGNLIATGACIGGSYALASMIIKRYRWKRGRP